MGVYYSDMAQPYEPLQNVDEDEMPRREEEHSTSPAEEYAVRRTYSPPLREEEYPHTNNLVLASKPYRGPCICFQLTKQKNDTEEYYELRMSLHRGICIGSTRDLPRGIYV